MVYAPLSWVYDPPTKPLANSGARRFGVFSNQRLTGCGSDNLKKERHMKKILLTTTAAIALSASAVFAQSIAEQVISQLQSEGYQSIEVTNGRTQVKVEAIRDGMKLEVIYDALTGAILQQEVEEADDDERNDRGVRIENDDEDFLDDDEDDENDDDEDDDNDDDEDDNDDDEDDDNDDDEDDDNDDDEGDDSDDDSDDE